MPRILMLAFAQMQPLDFIGPYDLFCTAGIETLVVAQDGTIAFDGRLSVQADVNYQTAPEADAIFVPGGYGVSARLASDETLRFLAECTVNWYTSVCTGSLLLAAAGLLRGYRATTHWRYLDLLTLGGATPVPHERIVIDRNRMTGGGVTAGIDFGIVLLTQLCGEETARFAQLALEYAPAPPYEGAPRDARPETVRKYKESTLERFNLRKAEMVHALGRMKG